jgi:hypothetical protein
MKKRLKQNVQVTGLIIALILRNKDNARLPEK